MKEEKVARTRSEVLEKELHRDDLYADDGEGDGIPEVFAPAGAPVRKIRVT